MDSDHQIPSSSTVEKQEGPIGSFLRYNGQYYYQGLVTVKRSRWYSPQLLDWLFLEGKTTAANCLLAVKQRNYILNRLIKH